MLDEEARDDLRGTLETFAHGRLAVAGRLEPYGKLDDLLDLSAAAIVHQISTLLDAQRAAGQIADRHQFAAGQRAAQRRQNLPAVTEDADMEAVKDGLPPHAAQHQRVQQAIER